MIAENTLLKPVTIGDMVIETPLSLAPMAGQTNHAFRRLCREIGGVGLVCTELLSSVPLQFKGGLKTSLQYFDWTPDERPFAVQLFGNDPYVMAEASKIVVEYGAAIVDINMGCWVPKVVKKGGGAALLKDVCAATEVVEACVKAVDVPVTVKVRAGFEDGIVTAIPFARAAQDVGAQMIAVHARFASQGFTGTADWDVIRRVKENVTTIPVFGNGDVTCAADARRMLVETGCDGVMIGRAALGNPWLFKQIEHELRTGEPLPPPTPLERAQTCLYQAELTLETTRMNHKKAILELRGQLLKYVTGLEDASTLRANLVQAESLDDIRRALSPILDTAG